MKVAIEGCAHGELDIIYETIQVLEKENNISVDLLIICGDFQAVRNTSDLTCMAVPWKYQKLNTFYKYYSGEKKAPILTIFIGGNHEASNYMSELPYGGWVCENIFYMGYASIIQIGDLRIGGLSGIYKGQDFLKGHFEILPYDEASKRSVYHIRNIDVFRLKQVTKPLDIFISHDWPRGIQEYGDKVNLLRRKPFFKDDMESGKLGSRPSEELLFKLRPRYWFAAHLHCQFAAIVPHDDNTVTKFLALDKCLPKRDFLKIIDIDTVNKSPSTEIKYDPEWLSILKSTNHLLSVSRVQNYMPAKGCSDRWDFTVTDEELANVSELFNDDFKIPRNFSRTALPHDGANQPDINAKPQFHVNPQTTLFCTKLGIDDPSQLLYTSEKKTSNRFSFVEDLNITNVSETSFDPDQSINNQNSGATVDDDTDDISSLFVIDTTPNTSFSSSSLSSHFNISNSPAHNEILNEQKLSHPFTSSPVSGSKSPKRSFEFPEYKEQNTMESPGSNTTATPPIKIKRRNLSLYANDGDNDDNGTR